MPSISDQRFKDIREWYAAGMSAREIAARLKVSLDAVYYFLRRHSIQRRNAQENNAIRFAKKKPSFIPKEKLSSREQQLKVAGIMLYWAEGSQWEGEGVVDFANSNPEMIRLFMSFLRRICRIDEFRLRIYVYCYSNQRPQELIRYWSKLTNIPVGQFTKPYIRKDFNPKKAGKMIHGLIHIRYYDKKLLLLIRNWIFHYGSSLS